VLHRDSAKGQEGRTVMPKSQLSEYGTVEVVKCDGDHRWNEIHTAGSGVVKKIASQKK
jgi:hypothetical protein